MGQQAEWDWSLQISWQWGLSIDFLLLVGVGECPLYREYSLECAGVRSFPVGHLLS